MTSITKHATFIIAVICSTLIQPVSAAVLHEPHTSVTATASANTPFSIELNQMANNEAVILTISNHSGKSLSVTLHAADGTVIDNFYTGKRITQLDKKYNFLEADAGLYSIEVTDGAAKVLKQIKFERTTVQTVNKISIQ